MPPTLPSVPAEHALNVWSIVIPEVQIAVLIALVLIAGGWLWHRVMIKRLEMMPERRMSAGVPPEVLTGILEEMSRNQAATTVALEHLAHAVESLNGLVRDNRCSYREWSKHHDHNAL